MSEFELLITPETQQARFTECCRLAESIEMYLAWLEAGDEQGPSWTQLAPYLNKVKRAVIGLAGFRSDPGLLRLLYKLGVLRLVQSSDGSFSPNLFVFKAKEQVLVLVGSAPFTSSKLHRSVESLVYFSGDERSDFVKHARSLAERCNRAAKVPVSHIIGVYEECRNRALERVDEFAEPDLFHEPQLGDLVAVEDRQGIKKALRLCEDAVERAKPQEFEVGESVRLWIAALNVWISFNYEERHHVLFVGCGKPKHNEEVNPPIRVPVASRGVEPALGGIARDPESGRLFLILWAANPLVVGLNGALEGQTFEVKTSVGPLQGLVIGEVSSREFLKNVAGFAHKLVIATDKRRADANARGPVPPTDEEGGEEQKAGAHVTQKGGVPGSAPDPISILSPEISGPKPEPARPGPTPVEPTPVEDDFNARFDDWAAFSQKLAERCATLIEVLEPESVLTNALRKKGVKTIGDLVNLNPNDFEKWSGVGTTKAIKLRQLWLRARDYLSLGNPRDSVLESLAVKGIEAQTRWSAVLSGLPGRVVKALNRHGVETFVQLLNLLELKPHEMLEWENFGPNSMKDLRDEIGRVLGAQTTRFVPKPPSQSENNVLDITRSSPWLEVEVEEETCVEIIEEYRQCACGRRLDSLHPSQCSSCLQVGSSDFVVIAPGSFLMGSPANEEGRLWDETQHRVTLTRGFFLQTTPVTQAQWQSLMGNNPSHFVNTTDAANCPVEQVSWYDALAYCNALSAREGLQPCYDLSLFTGSPGTGTYHGPDDLVFDLGSLGYRLPTEAEWEYAARAGTSAARYGALKDIAWHHDNSGSKTHRVGTLAANAWGLYDLLGNVWEWTWDWDGDYPASATDPVGPKTGSNRVIRGGFWFSDAQGARAACRCNNSPGWRDNSFGFRLSRSA